MPERLPDLSVFTEWDERLREVAVDPEEIDAAIDAAELQLAQGEPSAESRLLGYLGNATRVLGRTDESLDYQRRSLDAAPDETARVKALIRIGETHRCRDEYEQGIAVLREAAALAHVEAPRARGLCAAAPRQDASSTPDAHRRASSNWSVRLRFGSERATPR